MVIEKRNKIIEGILYYRIYIYFYIALFIVLSKDSILSIICYYLDISDYGILYNLYRWIVYYGSFIILGIVFFVTARSRRYKLLTNGRSFFRDSIDFNKSYRELVEFHTQKADNHQLNTYDCPIIDWWDVKGIVLGTDSKGKLVFLKSDCESNFLVIGPPGSWKTRGHVIPNCMTFAGSVVCVDPKGEVAAYVKAHSNRKILIFCPDSPNALKESVRFDILNDYHNLNPTDKKLFIENIANILIIPEGGEAGAFFTTRSRKILRSICHYILEEEKPDADFPYIIHNILQHDIFYWGNKIENGNCIVAKELILSLKDGNERNLGGAYDTLTTNLLPYSNDVLDVLLSNKEPNKCVTLKHLDLGYDLYLQFAAEHASVYSRLFSLILQQGLLIPFMKRPDASSGKKIRPILFMMDEFPRLAESISYDTIDQMLATLRSKKILLDLIIQNIGQLEKVYGQEGAKAIMSNCNCQVVLAANDTDSANYFSELFGKKWVLKRSTSLTNSSDQSSSNGISVIEDREDIYTPADIMDLPSDNSMLVYFKGKHAKLRKIKAT